MASILSSKHVDGSDGAASDIASLVAEAEHSLRALTAAFDAVRFPYSQMLGLSLKDLETMHHGVFWAPCPMPPYGDGMMPMSVDEVSSYQESRPLALARYCGISVQDAREYVERRDCLDPSALEIPVPCNHRGCRNVMRVRFNSPQSMLVAKQRAASEIWYCHAHQRQAWETERALSDNLLPILASVRRSPGTSMKAIEADSKSVKFLASIGLLRMDGGPPSGVRSGYEIYITADGANYLQRKASLDHTGQPE